MRYNYKTKDTCATEIEFDIENSILNNVKFTGGCNGNLKAVTQLVEGMKVEDVIKKVGGIKCGRRPTSCTGQLALALENASKDTI